MDNESIPFLQDAMITIMQLNPENHNHHDMSNEKATEVQSLFNNCLHNAHLLQIMIPDHDKDELIIIQSLVNYFDETFYRGSQLEQEILSDKLSNLRILLYHYLGPLMDKCLVDCYDPYKAVSEYSKDCGFFFDNQMDKLAKLLSDLPSYDLRKHIEFKHQIINNTTLMGYTRVRSVIYSIEYINMLKGSKEQFESIDINAFKQDAVTVTNFLADTIRRYNFTMHLTL